MFDEGFLHLADKTVHLVGCKYAITKVGIVTLEMYVGAHRTLTEVQYVLDLKKNSISVRSLELEGYEVSLRRGITRVTCKRAGNHENYLDQ